MVSKEARRDFLFNQASQRRIIELAGLVDADGQQQLRLSDQGALSKKERRKLEAGIAAHTGSLTVVDALAIANRYALWSVRNWYDWRKGVPREIATLDRRICGAIRKLDVDIRRDSERLVLATPTNNSADSLRSAAEEEAWQLATDLDAGNQVRDGGMWYWMEIRQKIGEVLCDLDYVLTLAGSSSQGRKASLTRTGWFHVTWPPDARGAWFLVEPGGMVRSSYDLDPGLSDDLTTSMLIDQAHDELRTALGSAPLSPLPMPTAAFTWSPPLPVP